MIAEFEADLARARTREGMALPKAKGRLRGKQPKLKPTREAQLVALWRAGNHTTLELAEMFDVARSTVYQPSSAPDPHPPPPPHLPPLQPPPGEHARLRRREQAARVAHRRRGGPASRPCTRQDALRQLCLPGQSRLHFTKEQDDRRRQILTAILDLGVVVDLYDATGIRNQQQAWAACLRALMAGPRRSRWPAARARAGRLARA